MLQPAPTVGDTEWFMHDRFGMFIHWGLYALAARHEWVKNIEEISDADYQKYFDHFNPDLFDPKEWARVAGEAGMNYFVITTSTMKAFVCGTANTPIIRRPKHLMVKTYCIRSWTLFVPKAYASVSTIP